MRFRRFCLPKWMMVLVAGLLLPAMRPTASPAATIFMTIVQRAAADGTVDYSLRTTIPPLGTMTSPDGTVLANSFRSFEGLSYADLSNRFYGTWTIHDTVPAPATYHFTLSAVPVHPLATIVSPGDGATVPSTFDVHWTFADDNHPPSPVHSRVVLAPVTFEYPFGDSGVRFHVDLDGQASVPMQVRGGAIESLIPYASAVTPIEFHTPAHTVIGSYLSLSAPVNLTVVPEPGGMELASLSLAALIAKRVRRWALAG